MAAQQNWIKVLDTIEVQFDSTNPVPNIQNIQTPKKLNYDGVKIQRMTTKYVGYGSKSPKSYTLCYYPCIHSTGLRHILNEPKSSQKVYAVIWANLSKHEERLDNNL